MTFIKDLIVFKGKIMGFHCNELAVKRGKRGVNRKICTKYKTGRKGSRPICKMKRDIVEPDASDAMSNMIFLLGERRRIHAKMKVDIDVTGSMGFDMGEICHTNVMQGRKRKWEGTRRRERVKWTNP